MPPTLIELRPNRRLLDNDFEGYKLNLNALPHWSYELQTPTDKVHPDDTQYSFLHAKLFALHNHLVADRWNHRYTFYYIDHTQQVRRVAFDNEYHLFQSSVVYNIPVHGDRKPGHFNLCLTFPSNDLALISDGRGYLNLVSTEGRGSSDAQWKTLHSTLVLEENKYFVIIDCRTQEKNDETIVHCLLQSIEQVNNHFHSVLSWLTFTKVEMEWKQISMRQLQGKGIVHYAAIETNFTALYIASDNQFNFINDTEYNILDPPKDEKKIIYTWLQTMEDITICLKLPQEYDKKLFHVEVGRLNIKVSYAGTMFINGILENNVDSELTTWNVQENGQVDILVTKSNSLMWKQLVEGGDESGEQVMDTSLVEEAHMRLAHLCSESEVAPDKMAPGLSTQQLEECDAASEEDTTLVRLDVSDHKVTHRIPLSVLQYLFHIIIEPTEVPAIALRHDVDACLWQPYAKLPTNNQWLMQHQGTLSAFGYIQSSKQNKKFVTCPPNFGYSVVCESSRHIFLYKNFDNESHGCQLRRRTPGTSAKKVNVGHQYLFNIDKYGQVLGIHATNSHLFILTETMLVAIEI